MNVIFAILWKDLLTEWRTRDRFIAMTVFILLVVVVFHFTSPMGPNLEDDAHLSGLLWVSIIFAAILGLNRSLSLELENEALSGLAMAPANRGLIYLGKTFSNIVILCAVEAIAATAFDLAFGLNIISNGLLFSCIAVLGSIGICSVGTLLATLSVRTSYRDIILPLLLLPMLIPTLAASVESTIEIVGGKSLPWDAVRLLIISDAIFLIISFLGFEYILEE